MTGEFKPTVFDQAPYGTLHIGKPVRGFRERIFLPLPYVLVSLCGLMNVELVEGLTFDCVGVLVALAIVSAEAKKLVRFWGTEREDHGEIQDVEDALAKYQPVLASIHTAQIHLAFLVPAFWTDLNARLIIRRQRLAFADESRDVLVGQSNRHRSLCRVPEEIIVQQPDLKVTEQGAVTLKFTLTTFNGAGMLLRHFVSHFEW
jgi:hypothetical protein